jgi:hypothetical protein
MNVQKRVSLENEALRAQLASNGIEPAPEQFRVDDSFHVVDNSTPITAPPAPSLNSGKKTAQFIDSKALTSISAHDAIEMEFLEAEGQVAEVWRKLRAYADEHGHMKAVELFKTFDQNSNGFIEQAEFEATLKAMGIVNLSQEVICAVMSSADKNGDGTLDYLELVAKLKEAD